MFSAVNFIGRDQIAAFLNRSGLKFQAVEVGTHRGDFARTFLDSWQGDMLYCVDPWEQDMKGYEYQQSFLENSEGREADYEAACSLLAPYMAAGRCQLLRMTSLDAATRFDDGTIDFVYLDGDHSTAAVYSDLQAWWPKVAEGGYIGGHDIIMPNEIDGLWAPGIQQAVMPFLALHQGKPLTLLFVPEQDGMTWSFLIKKEKA